MSGSSPRERGYSFEHGIREYFGLEAPADPQGKSAVIPDAVLGDTAFEIKYSDDFSTSIYNPNVELGFTHRGVQRNVEQARRYEEKYAGGVIYVTNNAALATEYAELFRSRGIVNFHFVVIPASK